MNCHYCGQPVDENAAELDFFGTMACEQCGGQDSQVQHNTTLQTPDGQKSIPDLERLALMLLQEKVDHWLAEKDVELWVTQLIHDRDFCDVLPPNRQEQVDRLIFSDEEVNQQLSADPMIYRLLKRQRSMVHLANAVALYRRLGRHLPAWGRYSGGWDYPVVTGNEINLIGHILTFVRESEAVV